LSRPAVLIYNHSANESLSLDIDPERGTAVINTSAKSCPECCPPGDADSTTLAGSIKGTKSRLAKVRQDL
jgi:hypothetical protein